MHSNGINVHGHQLTHQFFCEHFSDTLGDVVASFPFGEADSSVTAAIQKVLSCCNTTGNEFIWEARFVPYFCAGFLLLAAIAGLKGSLSMYADWLARRTFDLICDERTYSHLISVIDGYCCSANLANNEYHIF